MLDLWELSLLDAIQAHCLSAWGDLVMPAISSLGWTSGCIGSPEKAERRGQA